MLKFIKFKHYIRIFTLAGAVTLVAVPAFAQTVQNPTDGSIGLEAQVTGPGPDTPAFITSPDDGQNFSTSPILVRGSCTQDVLVQIYRGGAFAGSALCDQNGSFTIQIDLVVGSNQLVARVFDALNQQGPDSDTVSVTYQPVQVNPSTSQQNPFLLVSPFGARGVDPGKQLSWPLSISGGDPPYAVSINWGDGQDSLVSQSDTGSFPITHTYELSGSYIVVVKATDNEGRVTFLQLVSIVNGPAVAGFNIQDQGPASFIQRQYIIWPLYVLGAVTALSFWLGRSSIPHSKQRYDFRKNDPSKYNPFEHATRSTNMEKQAGKEEDAPIPKSDPSS